MIREEELEVLNRHWMRERAPMQKYPLDYFLGGDVAALRCANCGERCAQAVGGYEVLRDGDAGFAILFECESCPLAFELAFLNHKGLVYVKQWTLKPPVSPLSVSKWLKGCRGQA